MLREKNTCHLADIQSPVLTFYNSSLAAADRYLIAFLWFITTLLYYLVLQGYLEDTPKSSKYHYSRTE